jgi:hypothetical protein
MIVLTTKIRKFFKTPIVICFACTPFYKSNKLSLLKTLWFFFKGVPFFSFQKDIPSHVDLDSFYREKARQPKHIGQFHFSLVCE